ncbi:hypothetical protein [Spongiimicrobium salis]|uniref:hypothetical protein n=1 Tax=Spongiimicrobium salis TaxID=1667022 RepID=UPI00374D3DA0
MNKKLISFAGKLIIALAVLALLHMAYFYFRTLEVPVHLMLFGYGVNFILALVVYGFLLYFAERKSTQLGFLFLFGSALKFGVYFLVFHPMFKADGTLSKLEFFTFFFPYFICLAIETIALVKLLNEID